jgi:hypothetical protein
MEYQNTEEFFNNFTQEEISNFSKPILYTLEDLYKNDVKNEEHPEIVQDVLKAYNTLWNERETMWIGNLPEGWIGIPLFTLRSYICKENKYPNLYFKFCSSTPGKGVPGAHFLRVPKGKELKKIIESENLYMLGVVNEYLISVKSLEKIRKLSEYEQSYNFVVVSEIENLMNVKDTANYIISLDEETQNRMFEQLMRLICKSGIRNLTLNNIRIHRDTKKLIIADTEPLFGSLLLDENTVEKKHQYYRNNQLKKIYHKSRLIIESLEDIIKYYKNVKILEENRYNLNVLTKFAEEYKKKFLEINSRVL